MSIKMNVIRCPECGASLPEGERKQLFCAYCGNKLQLTNDNEQVIRHIDEASIRKTETERLIKLKELEMKQEHQRHIDHVKTVLTYVWITSAVAVAVICLIVWSMAERWGGFFALITLLFVGGPVVAGGAYLIFKVIPEKEVEKIHVESQQQQNIKILFPTGLEPFETQTYEVVQSVLVNAGFTNITCVNMHDIILGLMHKPGEVELITIAGQRVSHGGRYYRPNVPITITYHGL